MHGTDEVNPVRKWGQPARHLARRVRFRTRSPTSPTSHFSATVGPSRRRRHAAPLRPRCLRHARLCAARARQQRRAPHLPQDRWPALRRGRLGILRRPRPPLRLRAERQGLRVVNGGRRHPHLLRERRVPQLQVPRFERLSSHLQVQELDRRAVELPVRDRQGDRNPVHFGLHSLRQLQLHSRGPGRLEGGHLRPAQQRPQTGGDQVHVKDRKSGKHV